jgi:hypothetical protein
MFFLKTSAPNSPKILLSGHRHRHNVPVPTGTCFKIAAALAAYLTGLSNNI